MAVATPCWPAPVSATSRCLPMRRASSAWPRTLLILWLPVWLRSSRFSRTRQPELGAEPVALGEERRAAGVVAQEVVELGRGRPGRPTPRRTRPRAPRRRARASRARTGRRSGRSDRRGAGSPITRVVGHGHSAAEVRTRRRAYRRPERFVFPVVRRVVLVARRSPAGAAARALRTKSRTFIGSLCPGDDSTPVDTSTPHGRTRSMASATFSGVRPPARMNRRPIGAPSASDQSNTSPEPGRVRRR